MDAKPSACLLSEPFYGFVSWSSPSCAVSRKPRLGPTCSQVLGVGGKEALCKGWKVVSAAQPAAGKKAVLSSKAAKKARVCYVSPQGNKFESVQAVMKHLGLVGLSRANAFLQAQAFRQENGCPFTIKMQQGQLTVQALGNLMVEKVLRCAVYLWHAVRAFALCKNCFQSHL